MSVYIVAEIGCNHNGSIVTAKKMVAEAKAAGVDAVKFQMFKAHNLITASAPKAEYQKLTTGPNESQLEMTRKLELSQQEYLELKKYAEDLELDVFSTPFDEESIDFLERIGQKNWKIPSGEITNLPYLERIARLNISNPHIILSTGMSTINEIRYAIHILQKGEKRNITLLQCNTEYPTPDEDMNLRAIEHLKTQFPDCNIGLSDHSIGIIASIIALSYDIVLIEKHFTLDKNLPGPDHKASATPQELKMLCESVRRGEIMLGSYNKLVTPSEEKNKFVARKSIVAKKHINKGDTFNTGNITCKRPGNGISPLYWHKVLGSMAERDFEEDELITCKGIMWEEERQL